MKENKYKLWRKSESKWIDEGWVITSDGEVVLYVNGGNIIGYCNMDYHILVAYTGMKDCKGKEIYEGDILKCKLSNGKYENYLVEWIEENCSFEAWNKDKSNFMDCAIWSNFEIIGNIFENKELLEVE